MDIIIGYIVFAALAFFVGWYLGVDMAFKWLAEKDKKGEGGVMLGILSTVYKKRIK